MLDISAKMYKINLYNAMFPGMSWVREDRVKGLYAYRIGKNKTKKYHLPEFLSYAIDFGDS